LFVLLFLAASVGHTALLVFALNWTYGHALPRKLLRAVRRGHALLVLAGPVLFWFAYGLDVRPALDPANLGQTLLAPYTILCVLLGVGVVPVLVVQKRLRRRPAALLSNHTKTINVAAELGYKPFGRGKHRLLARLPLNEIFRVDFAVRTLEVPDLPAAWDGLTILHLTDLHFSGVPDRAFYQFLMDRCREWDPDLVAITGDVVDSEIHHRWIVPTLGRLRWRHGAFAVLGNHDYWHDPAQTRRRLGKLGIDVLGNGWRQIEVRGEPLVIVGHEGPWFQPGPDLSACPQGPFRLCLSHTPDNIAWARQHHINLMLAGHNHGGQIRLPLVGSVFVPSRYGRRYDCGTFHEPPTLLHVCRGLAGQEPLRYNCRPEVALLVLRKAASPPSNPEPR
jgi:predicted MPP superfamily phosphohydrolase